MEAQAVRQGTGDAPSPQLGFRQGAANGDSLTPEGQCLPFPLRGLSLLLGTPAGNLACAGRLSEAENARARERAARSMATAEAALAQERARAEAALSILEAIDQAAAVPGQDGEVAPVLLDTLKRLT